jgi:hypothetical protein
MLYGGSQIPVAHMRELTEDCDLSQIRISYNLCLLYLKYLFSIISFMCDQTIHVMCDLYYLWN